MAPPEQPTLSEIKTEKEHQSKSIIELHYFLKSAIIKTLIWKMVCILGLRGAWTSIKKNAIRCLVFFLTAIFVVSGVLALRELQSRLKRTSTGWRSVCSRKLRQTKKTRRRKVLGI